MAKKCAICDKKLGLMSSKIKVADGIICDGCWKKAGLDTSLTSLYNASNKTVDQIRYTMGEKVPSNNCDSYSNTPSKSEAHLGKSTDSSSEYKPLDITLTFNKKGFVNFSWTGNPVVSFDDIVEGENLVAGNVTVINNSRKPLPQVKLLFQLSPKVIDDIAVIYKSGSILPGNTISEPADNPTIILEEYNRIKKKRKGALKITLFLDGIEVGGHNAELEIKAAPADKIKSVIRSVEYEEAKCAPGPVDIFLSAEEDGRYMIDALKKPELLYSLYSNDREQIIGDVYVNNESEHSLENVEFEARFTSDILSDVDVLLGTVRANEAVVFGVDDPAINIDHLEQLTEIETCTATYRILVDGKAVAETTGKLMICPYDQWNGNLALLPAYITPNHPEIVRLLQAASEWMMKKYRTSSLEGYQGDSKRIENMVEAVFNAVKNSGIAYSNPPASFFGPQRIRLCNTVIDSKFGTCMDMTILFASCVESFGLHPVLITAQGHIFAGVWKDEDSTLFEPVISDVNLLRSYVKDGRLLVIECTGMNSGSDLNYKKAKVVAENTLNLQSQSGEENYHSCIDVNMLRQAGLRPLPMRNKKSTENNYQEKAINTSENIPLRKESERSNDISIYKREEYKGYETDLSFINSENFYDKELKKTLNEEIVHIVAVEGPISQPELIKTLVGLTSITRAGSKINEYIDKLVTDSEVKITRQNGVRFLWTRGFNPSDYMIYRFKEQRNPETLSKYELKNGVCLILQENGPLKEDAIQKELISLLGYSRSSKKLEDCSKIAIKYARELKAVEKGDDGVYRLI